MSAFYKKILVPVDGSGHAERACTHAIGLAGAEGEIVLLHCYGDLPNLIGGDARDEVVAASEAEGRRYLASCGELCAKANVKYRGIVHKGNPGRIIVQVANEEQCDLIVMGSRGLSDFSGMVMGSVSHRVLEYATLPVLIVK